MSGEVQPVLLSGGNPQDLVLDEAMFRSWISQASRLPGEKY